MSFPYTTGLPNPPNDPSNDVGGMQQNTNTINSWTAVDHVGFNNSAGGQHKQITFNNTAAPSSPTDPLSYLFTSLVSSHPQLFFLNSINTYQLTNLALTSLSNFSGNQKGLTTPWGLILNWGDVQGFGSGTAITFPVGYTSTSSYWVFAQALGTSPTAIYGVTNFSSTQFKLFCNVSPPHTNFFAIGY